MAGDWIKMRDNLWDDPRVAKVVDMTDSSEAAVIGSLYWLWSTADQHTEDGFMQGLTLKSINRKTGVPGFAEALCAINWLEERPDGVFIVDFEKHNGSSAKKRCQTAKRVANHAAANGKPAKCADSANAPITYEENKTNADSVSSALAREEKRREEEIPSVAIATGGKPPNLTPVEIIFGYGLPILTNAGTAEKQARSFLGGLRKAHGDDSLVNALRECIKAKPLQPLEWLAKALPPDGCAGTGKPSQRESFRERDDRLAAERIAEFMPGIAAKKHQSANVIDITPQSFGALA